MSQALDTHACTAYCTPDVHCDLVYSGRRDARTGEAVSAADVSGDRHYIAVDFWRLGATVTRIIPAREAPSLASLPPDRQQRLSMAPEGQVDEYRWLVFWRERHPGERPFWQRRGHRMGEFPPEAA